jgi:CMP-N,N'-diacetyllegionaminic acid synthase
MPMNPTRPMNVIATILARGGSMGLPRKNFLPLLGKPVFFYTVEHARESELIDTILLTTDSPEIKELARPMKDVIVIDRPAGLATNTATVDSAARDAVLQYEAMTGYNTEIVVILYGNVPVRAPGIVDRAVKFLIDTGADSVRTVAKVGKTHPDWLHHVDEQGRMTKFRENNIYRRQDLELLYFHDGSVLTMTRQSLFTPPAHEHDFHAFFGRDRRAIIQDAQDTVDIDTIEDFHMAEALLKLQREELFLRPTAQLESRPG